MEAMLVEVAEHEATREEQAQERIPALHRREELRLIEQHEAQPVRSQKRDRAQSEDARAVDETILPRHLLGITQGIGDEAEGVADKWKSVIAGNMRERSAIGPRESRLCGNGAADSGGGDHGLPRSGPSSVESSDKKMRAQSPRRPCSRIRARRRARFPSLAKLRPYQLFAE